MELWRQKFKDEQLGAQLERLGTGQATPPSVAVESVELVPPCWPAGVN